MNAELRMYTTDASRGQTRFLQKTWFVHAALLRREFLQRYEALVKKLSFCLVLAQFQRALVFRRCLIP